LNIQEDEYKKWVCFGSMKFVSRCRRYRLALAFT
jgi:hypothetical protein